VTTDDKRLIEDYLPIEKISAEGRREKLVRKGHISTLHLWWARRPLVACRAAVYGALVPLSRFAPNGASDDKKKSLGRANAAKFVERLCQYPGSPSVIAEAHQHILEAHADRLTEESGKKVTVGDIVEGRAPRPKVLDMFAGGGAIPLEALRLGCEAYALELNPVAHIIELCTLLYPQRYGKPDPTGRGMTGPKNARGEATWGGLAEEFRYWGEGILKQVKAEIGDLYPLIPDPEFKRKKTAVQTDWIKDHISDDVPPGYLMPVAYLWTRTVICKNPNCGATVPLLRQTWLCKKQSRNVALKMIAPKGKKQVRFEVVEARTESALGFDPAIGSKGGNAACPFCGTVADSDYVKTQGYERIRQELMALVCHDSTQETRYISPADASGCIPSAQYLNDAIASLDQYLPNELMNTEDPTTVAGRGFGIKKWRDLFLPRQLLLLGMFARSIRSAQTAMAKHAEKSASVAVLTSYLGLALDRLANYHTAFNIWRPNRTCVLPLFSRQAIPMVWDSGEMNPFSGSAGDWHESIEYVAAVIEELTSLPISARVARGSAVALPYEEGEFDAIVSDPPYYDNVSYAVLSDFFYVWLKRVVGDFYPDDFAAALTPKRGEAIADSVRHGDSDSARRVYESLMSQAFVQAWSRLKPGAPLVLVYAHKTTSGWTTLVNALRSSGFEVLEAWPLDTEMAGGMKVGTASLASSIFLVARKRGESVTGKYEERVRPELEQIVRERVDTLWEMGISGADLVIACVGAGLRAFTRFARVEYANGEEVPAERFLTEVETVVLETILARLSKEVGANDSKYSLAGLDAATRFYVLWRYTYKAADLDAGEAIIFANGTHVELDSAHGLSSGAQALVAKNKAKYRLLDFAERGDDAALGMPSEDGQLAPLIDALHRLLWLLERHPSGIPDFLRDARPNTEQMRLVAQALAGPALKGGELGEVATGTELAALMKLTANWRSVVEDVAEAAVGPLFRAPRQSK
jgi:putative DNA methylase